MFASQLSRLIGSSDDISRKIFVSSPIRVRLQLILYLLRLILDDTLSYPMRLRLQSRIAVLPKTESSNGFTLFSRPRSNSGFQVTLSRIKAVSSFSIWRKHCVTPNGQSFLFSIKLIFRCFHFFTLSYFRFFP